MNRTRLLIVDDHEIYRRGLLALLGSDFDVVAEAQEGGEAVDQALSHHPDVVLMDINLPGMSGIQATREIKARLPTTRVVIISESDDDTVLFDAIEAGVSGYLVKHDDAQTIITAIQHAADGKAYLPPVLAQRVMARVAGAINGRANLPGNPSVPLSARELSVLRLMAHGRRNKEIASQLVISERTVGNHISNIYAKLAIFDRAQAIVYAIKNGIVRV
jgi:two-component system NarL family response regulator